MYKPQRDQRTMLGIGSFWEGICISSHNFFTTY